MTALDIRGPIRAGVARETMARVTHGVACSYGITADDLRGRSRVQPIARARQEAYFLCREQGYTMTQIGGYFHRDHSTVSYGISQEKQRREAENAA